MKIIKKKILKIIHSYNKKTYLIFKIILMIIVFKKNMKWMKHYEFIK